MSFGFSPHPHRPGRSDLRHVLLTADATVDVVVDHGTVHVPAGRSRVQHAERALRRDTNHRVGSETVHLVQLLHDTRQAIFGLTEPIHAHRRRDVPRHLPELSGVVPHSLRRQTQLGRETFRRFLVQPHRPRRPDEVLAGLAHLTVRAIDGLPQIQRRHSRITTSLAVLQERGLRVPSTLTRQVEVLAALDDSPGQFAHLLLQVVRRRGIVGLRGAALHLRVRQPHQRVLRSLRRVDSLSQSLVLVLLRLRRTVRRFRHGIIRRRLQLRRRRRLRPHPDQVKQVLPLLLVVPQLLRRGLRRTVLVGHALPHLGASRRDLRVDLPDDRVTRRALLRQRRRDLLDRIPHLGVVPDEVLLLRLRHHLLRRRRRPRTTRRDQRLRHRIRGRLQLFLPRLGLGGLLREEPDRRRSSRQRDTPRPTQDTQQARRGTLQHAHRAHAATSHTKERPHACRRASPTRAHPASRSTGRDRLRAGLSRSLRRVPGRDPQRIERGHHTRGHRRPQRRQRRLQQAEPCHASDSGLHRSRQTQERSHRVTDTTSHHRQTISGRLQGRRGRVEHLQRRRPRGQQRRTDLRRQVLRVRGRDLLLHRSRAQVVSEIAGRLRAVLVHDRQDSRGLLLRRQLRRRLSSRLRHRLLLHAGSRDVGDEQLQRVVLAAESSRDTF